MAKERNWCLFDIQNKKKIGEIDIELWSKECPKVSRVMQYLHFSKK